MEIGDRYLDYIPVYTDGSRDGNAVACATVFPSNTIISMRLPDSASVFTAEVWANIKNPGANCIQIHWFYRLTFVSPSFTSYEAGTSPDWMVIRKCVFLHFAKKDIYSFCTVFCVKKIFYVITIISNYVDVGCMSIRYIV